MSQEIVNDINAAHPELLRANTPEANGRFCALTVARLGAARPGIPGWALLGKSGGENGVTWPNGVRTSHDAIVRVDASGNKTANVDIIGGAHGDKDGPARRAGVPTWGVIPHHEWRASNTPVALADVPIDTPAPAPTPVPTPAPPAPPAVDLRPILARLDAIEHRLLVQGNTIGALRTNPGSVLRHGRFSLELQGDGNLVIYEDGTAIWASGTAR